MRIFHRDQCHERKCGVHSRLTRDRLRPYILPIGSQNSTRTANGSTPIFKQLRRSLSYKDVLQSPHKVGCSHLMFCWSFNAFSKASLTSFRLFARISLARSWIHFVVGSPGRQTGLILKPPSDGGLWEV